MLQESSLPAVVWQHNRVRISLIGILLVSVICGYVIQNRIVNPRLQDLSTTQFQLQQQVRERQVEFSNSGVPISIAAQIEKNLQQFNALIPEQELFSRFLGELFAWAQDSGLSIHQINYKPEEDGETGFFRYGLTFSVNGNYAQLKNFLYFLENSERLLIVDKISLSGTSTVKNRESVNLRIQLTTFFQRRSA